MQEARSPFLWAYPDRLPMTAEMRTLERYIRIQNLLSGGPKCLLESDIIFSCDGSEKEDFQVMVTNRRSLIASKKDDLLPFAAFL